MFGLGLQVRGLIFRVDVDIVTKNEAEQISFFNDIARLDQRERLEDAGVDVSVIFVLLIFAKGDTVQLACFYAENRFYAYSLAGEHNATQTPV